MCILKNVITRVMAFMDLASTCMPTRQQYQVNSIPENIILANYLPYAHNIYPTPRWYIMHELSYHSNHNCCIPV